MNPYIQSLRLRTLPLSVAGIILGTGLAFRGQWEEVNLRQWIVFVLAIGTTLCLQILSNLSNELGDAQKGTDSNQRGREAYGLQTGTITPSQMTGMIGLFIVLSMLLGTVLVWTAFGTLLCIPSLVFLGLGLLAIVGAMTYTLGRHSYGYIGLGDLGVFLFFGLLSTMGAYALQTLMLTWEVTIAAIAIALPIVGVLNLNNIRDMRNDLIHGKRTFAGMLGPIGARIYHTLLIMGCPALFAAIGHYWTLLILPVWAWHLWFVWTHKDHLDSQMPVLMFSTLIVAILAIL